MFYVLLVIGSITAKQKPKCTYSKHANSIIFALVSNTSYLKHFSSCNGGILIMISFTSNLFNHIIKILTLVSNPGIKFYILYIFYIQSVSGQFQMKKTDIFSKHVPQISYSLMSRHFS